MSSDAYNASRGTGGAASSAPSFTLSRDDVAAAFAFFDVAGTGVLTSASLKARLSAFYPEMTTREYRFLVEDVRGGPSAAAPVSMSAAAAAAAQLASSPSGGKATSTANAQADGATAASPQTPAASAVPTNAAATTAAAASAASGLTLDQLWELLDTFQRTYMDRPVAGSDEGGGGGNGTAAPASVAHAEHGSGATSTPAGCAAVTPAALYDPVHEAFQVYDPRHTHAVDVQVLQHIMARIGFGALSEEELALLVRTADYDGDGKITLDDFRHLVCAKGRLHE